MALLAQVAHGRRNERLQAIQHELVQLASLGEGVVSTEQMNDKQRSRLLEDGSMGYLNRCVTQLRRHLR
ncbi:MAG: hypothetical protein WA474_21485 [Candidatus Sulfotelmatobacter sp.]